MSNYFETLFANDPMFHAFVISEGKDFLSDQDKAMILRKYYAIPFKEYYRRRLVFLAAKRTSLEPCCA